MARSLFTRPLELWRPNSESDGQGGRTDAVFAQVGDEPLLAKVDQPTARAQVVGAQEGATLVHPIYFDGVVDVRRGDELRDPSPGVDVFAVISVIRPSEPIYTKASCELRQVEGD